MTCHIAYRRLPIHAQMCAISFASPEKFIAFSVQWDFSSPFCIVCELSTIHHANCELNGLHCVRANGKKNIKEKCETKIKTEKERKMKKNSRKTWNSEDIYLCTCLCVWCFDSYLIINVTFERSDAYASHRCFRSIARETKVLSSHLNERRASETSQPASQHHQ